MRMMNRIAPLSAALLTLGGHAQADPGQLSLFNWSDFFAPTVLESFEQDTGLKIQIDTYSEADEAEAQLVSRGTGFDLAVVGSESAGRIVAEGGLQKFDPSLVPNADRHDGQLQHLMYRAMPEIEGYAIPYIWGTTGITYSKSAVAERIPNAPTDSWALIFDPENAAKLADCGIAILDSNEEVVAAILAYLGKDPLSSNEKDVDAAFDVLASIAPYISSYTSDQYDDLVNAELCLAISWSTEGLAPLFDMENEDYEFVLPKEGTNVWADLFVIPVDAQNAIAANDLVNYSLRPDKVAQIVRYAMASTRSPEVLAEIDSSYYAHPALSLPQDVLSKLYFVHPRDGHKKRALDRRWRMLQLGM